MQPIPVSGLSGNCIATVSLAKGETCSDAKRKIFETCGRRMGQQQLRGSEGILRDDESMDAVAEVTLVVPHCDSADPRIVKSDPSDPALVQELLNFFTNASVQILGSDAGSGAFGPDILMDTRATVAAGMQGPIVEESPKGPEPCCVLPLAKEQLCRALPWELLQVQPKNLVAVLALNASYHLPGGDGGGSVGVIALLDTDESGHELLAASAFLEEARPLCAVRSIRCKSLEALLQAAPAFVQAMRDDVPLPNEGDASFGSQRVALIQPELPYKLFEEGCASRTGKVSAVDEGLTVRLSRHLGRLCAPSLGRIFAAIYPTSKFKQSRIKIQSAGEDVRRELADVGSHPIKFEIPSLPVLLSGLRAKVPDLVQGDLLAELERHAGSVAASFDLDAAMVKAEAARNDAVAFDVKLNKFLDACDEAASQRDMSCIATVISEAKGAGIPENDIKRERRRLARMAARLAGLDRRNLSLEELKTRVPDLLQGVVLAELELWSAEQAAGHEGEDGSKAEGSPKRRRLARSQRPGDNERRRWNDIVWDACTVILKRAGQDSVKGFVVEDFDVWEELQHASGRV